MRRAILIFFILVTFKAIAVNDGRFSFTIGKNDYIDSAIVLSQSDHAVAIELTNQVGNILPSSNAYTIDSENYVPLVLAGDRNVFLYTMARVEGKKLVLGPFYFEMFYILGNIESATNLSVIYFDRDFKEIDRTQYKIVFPSSLFRVFPRRTMAIGAMSPFKLKDYQSPEALEQSVSEIVDASTAPLALSGDQYISAQNKTDMQYRTLRGIQCVMKHTKEKGLSEFSYNMLIQNMLMKQQVSLLKRVMMILAKSNGSNPLHETAGLKIMHFDTHDARSILMELKGRKQDSKSLGDDFEEYVSSMMSYVQDCVNP